MIMVGSIIGLILSVVFLGIAIGIAVICWVKTRNNDNFPDIEDL